MAGAFLFFPLAAAGEPAPLEPATPVERHLDLDAIHAYSAGLAPGPWCVGVEQIGADVAVEVRRADGSAIAADLPFGRVAREVLCLESEAEEAVEIEVRPAGKSAGRYRLLLERLAGEPRRLAAERSMAAASAVAKESAERAAEHLEEAAEIWRELGERRRLAEALHLLGLLERRLERPGAAIASLEQASGLYAVAGDPYREAEARNSLGLLYHQQGDLDRAGASYRRAFELLAEAPDARLEDRLHNNLGGLYQDLGDPELARRHLLAALELRRASGDREREAITLTNLASLDRLTGRWHDALERWQRALALFRDTGHRRFQATTLNSLGTAYLRLGETERARTFLARALELRREAGDRRGEAVTLDRLAAAYRGLGALPAARLVRREALALRRRLEDRRGEARTLVGLGHDALDDGEPRLALGHFDAALGLFDGDVEDPRTAAQAEAGRGRALSVLGRTADAAAAFELALRGHRAAGDRAGEVATRVAFAELERRRGRPQDALDQATAAIVEIEAQRADVPGAELRATFLASRRRAYELRVDLLVDLARRTGDASHLRTAWTAAERARARALLDLLVESEVDPARDVDPELRTRRRSLVERLRFLTEKKQPTDAAVAELDLVEAEIWRQHPAYAEILRPEPLDAGAVPGLLDPGTTLLQYDLGDQRSFLWRITPEALEVYDLPPREKLEDLARQAHRELATVAVGAPADGPGPLGELAKTVLGPVAAKLGGKSLRDKRLAIVADGALAYLPFGALPWPGEAGEPLLLRFEVVHLPSASALAAQRRRLPPAPRLTAAVIADPIFDPGDPRVASERNAPAARSGDGGPRYDRLPASRDEAEALAARLPPGELRSALGAEASRDAVLGGLLAGARFVHLATHGVLDAVRPELSGLVLSRVDAAGRPRDGFLALRDVYELDLDAELVVLSGCRTALGKEVRGEGLVGLVRGFFYAGATRVVASLWPIEDRATAALMERFYDALLIDGERPAAALRRAQLAVRSERRWRHPSYWAGFVLQGDWR